MSNLSTSDEMNQMAKDVHLLASPFRFIQQLIGISLAILFAPAILAYFVIGSYIQSEAVGFAKVLIGVFGPLVFPVWFALIVRISDSIVDPENERFPDVGNGQLRCLLLGLYFSFMSYVGVFLSLMWNLEGIPSLWWMIAGLFSPIFWYVIGRLTRMWFTWVTCITITVATFYRFAHAFGWV